MPIDGTFTMGINEAVQAALAVSPMITVPIHVGKNNPLLFKKELEKTTKLKARILGIGETMKL